MISEFEKERVFWTRKMNLKLVKFIENRPNMWNPKHPKYTSVAYRDKTYAEFAAKYGNEFTGQAVKDRWTNIRSTFANYLRKLNASRSKEGEEYKVNWHLWEACKFLLKVNKKLNNNLTASLCNNDEDTYNQLDTNEMDNESSADDSNSKCNDIVRNIATVFRGVQSDAYSLDNSKYAHVGRAVARKLSQMNSFDAAQLVHKITETLLVYNENNPANPNNLKLECI